MSLEEFHRNFRSDLQTIVADRVEDGEGPFPSDELVFAEMVMEHIAEAGICDSPTVCHWNGKVGNAHLRITGYAISSDESALDLFVTHYFGTEELSDLRDSDAAATASEGVRFLLRAASGNLEARIDPTHPVRDLVATIRSRWNSIDRLRVFVISDGRTKTKRFANKEVNGKMVAIEAMDMERLFRHTEGNLGLSFLKGLQIVNGGQTTSTIYFASRDDRTIDLSHVMVPAKIIILKGSQDEARERLISNVSRYANSQNAVKMSDLSANRPFHVQLEKLANDTWCPDGATRWFYERAAGAYNVMLLREGTTPAKRRKLKEMIPPKRKLTKNDIAKYHESWRGKPNQVGMAGEKNFAAFMAALDDDPTIVPNPVDARWYREMIAKVILFKSIESMIKTKEAKEIFRQGWVNIATYVVSVVSDRMGNALDLEQIWMRQGISAGLRDLLWDWAVVVNSEFNRIAPGQQISEVAKRAETWAKIRAADYKMPEHSIPEID